MRIPPLRFRLLLPAALALAAGCAHSPPSRHYLLEPVPAPAPAAATGAVVPLTLASVRMAEHLSGPRVPMRAGTNEVRFLEYERWAAAPDRNVESVLFENLARRLAGRCALAGPADPAPAGGLTAIVEILDMEGEPGGEARLRARVLLFRRDDRTLLDSWLVEQKHPAGASVSDWVAAQSANLGRLADDIAARVLQRL